MAIAAQRAYTDEVQDQVVHLKVPWSVYETLVETLGADSHARLTYDGEYLEIMSPGKPHDFLSSIIGQMILAVRDEWLIEITSYQTATFKDETVRRGFEGDQTYYVGNIENRIDDVWNPMDAATDPPPDLVVEVDITRKSSDKFPLFVEFGIPEVWHYTKRAFLWCAREGDAYVPITTSRMIRGLPLVEVANRVAVARPGNTRAFIAEWRQWLQANIHLHEAAQSAG